MEGEVVLGIVWIIFFHILSVPEFCLLVLFCLLVRAENPLTNLFWIPLRIDPNETTEINQLCCVSFEYTCPFTVFISCMCTFIDFFQAFTVSFPCNVFLIFWWIENIAVHFQSSQTVFSHPTRSCSLTTIYSSTFDLIPVYLNVKQAGLIQEHCLEESFEYLYIDQEWECIATRP